MGTSLEVMKKKCVRYSRSSVTSLEAGSLLHFPDIFNDFMAQVVSAGKQSGFDSRHGLYFCSHHHIENGSGIYPVVQRARCTG